MRKISTRALFYQLIPFSRLGKPGPFLGMSNKIVHWRSGPRLARKALRISGEESHGQMNDALANSERGRSGLAIRAMEAEKRNLSPEETFRAGGIAREVASTSDKFNPKVAPRAAAGMQYRPRTPFSTGADRQESNHSAPTKTSIATLMAGRHILHSAAAEIGVSGSRRFFPAADETSSATGSSYGTISRRTRLESTSTRNRRFDNSDAGQSANWSSASVESQNVEDEYCHLRTQLFGGMHDARLTSRSVGSQVMPGGIPGSLVMDPAGPGTDNVGGTGALATNGTVPVGQADTLPSEPPSSEGLSSSVGGELWLDVGNLGNWVLTHLTSEITRGSKSGNHSTLPI